VRKRVWAARGYGGPREWVLTAALGEATQPPVWRRSAKPHRWLCGQNTAKNKNMQMFFKSCREARTHTKAEERKEELVLPADITLSAHTWRDGRDPYSAVPPCEARWR
jgi:hypothetical protein